MTLAEREAVIVQELVNNGQPVKEARRIARALIADEDQIRRNRTTGAIEVQPIGPSLFE